MKGRYAGAPLELTVDRRSEAPLHLQIGRELRHAIVSGRLPPGTRLPSTRTLARECDVSRNTLLQAFEGLTAEGYLSARAGDGSYVAIELPDDPRSAITACEPPEQTAVQGGGYPFRRLSARGRTMVEQSVDLPAELPQPFTPDLPDLRAFPMRTWLRLTGEASGSLQNNLLANVSNAGYEPLRRAIATHLRAARGLECGWEQVIVTTGSQQSLDLVIRLMLDPGDIVWMPDPGYVGARSALQSGGCTVVSLDVDAEGVDIRAAVDRHLVPRLIFVTPSSHYPLNVTLSAARRLEIAAYAGRVGAWIVEDDYDSDFRYRPSLVQTIHTLDRANRVFYVGTFSKSLLPSFRLGFLIVPPDMVEPFAKARAIVDRHASLMEQITLAAFIERGHLASHTRRMRESYRTRQRSIIAAVTAMSGGRVVPAPVDCGTNLLLWLRPGIDDREASRAALELGIRVRPLSPYCRQPKERQAVILGFAAFSTDEIAAGIGRLRPLRDMLSA